jgi:hypothetical protein
VEKLVDDVDNLFWGILTPVILTVFVIDELFETI